MGIRQKINEHPVLTSIATGIILLAALVFIIIQATKKPRAVPARTKDYYTTDEGKTWFADSVNKVPPFDYNGQEAVRARIYRCGKGPEFVFRLERYRPQAKKQIEELLSKPEDQRVGINVLWEDVEMKRPGGTKWFRMEEVEDGKLLNPRCPDGSVETLQRVWPPEK